MKLFNLDWKTMLLVGILVAAFILALVVKCHAAPYMQLSAGSTYVRGPTPVLDLAATWPAPQRDKDFWKADLTVLGTSTYRTHAVPNNFMLRGLYVTGFGNFDVGLGLAWLQNPAPYNGSPINFTLELAYRFQRWPITLSLSHVSNAGTQTPNLGRDFITLGWRFKP